MTVDRTSLGFLGAIFGGITAAVMAVAFTVVLQHVEGRMVLDPTPVAMVSVR